MQSCEERVFVRRKNEHRVRVRNPALHILCPLHIDVECDEFSRLECVGDLGSQRAVPVATEDLRNFDEAVFVDIALESRLIDEVIVHVISFASCPSSRRRAHAELAAESAPHLMHHRGFPNATRP